MIEKYLLYSTLVGVLITLILNTTCYKIIIKRWPSLKVGSKLYDPQIEIPIFVFITFVTLFQVAFFIFLSYCIIKVFA